MQATPGAPLTAGGPGGAGGADTASPAPRRRAALVLSVAAVAWTADVVTKVLAVEHLTDRSPVTLVPGVLQLALTRNSGAAFSIATGLTVLLTVIAFVVVVVVLRLVTKVRSTGWALALGLLLGGALGNLTDRVFRDPAPLRGHVVDFLELPHWPVFNLADASIVAAAALIALQSLRGIGLDGAKVADRPPAGRHSGRERGR
jgi:signal peptidase II